jgi:hypothetical protein
MLIAFRALPLLWRVLTIAGALAAILGTLGGIYLYIDHEGYRRATLEWQIKYDKREAELKQQLADELDRQQSINAMAKADEEAALEAYRLKLEAATKLALQLADEAAKDPNAGNIALDAGAVDRHNRRIN